MAASDEFEVFCEAGLHPGTQPLAAGDGKATVTCPRTFHSWWLPFARPAPCYGEPDVEPLSPIQRSVLQSPTPLKNRFNRSPAQCTPPSAPAPPLGNAALCRRLFTGPSAFTNVDQAQTSTVEAGAEALTIPQQQGLDAKQAKFLTEDASSALDREIWSQFARSDLPECEDSNHPGQLQRRLEARLRLEGKVYYGPSPELAGKEIRPLSVMSGWSYTSTPTPCQQPMSHQDSGAVRGHSHAAVDSKDFDDARSGAEDQAPGDSLLTAMPAADTNFSPSVNMQSRTGVGRSYDGMFYASYTSGWDEHCIDDGKLHADSLLTGENLHWDW